MHLQFDSVVNRVSNKFTLQGPYESIQNHGRVHTLWFGISEIKVLIAKRKLKFLKNLFSKAMFCVKCSPILRMLSLHLLGV